MTERIKATMARTVEGGDGRRRAAAAGRRGSLDLRRRLALAVLIAAAVGLGGCGARGPTDSLPDPDVNATEWNPT